MAGLDDIGRVDKIFGNGTPRDEPGLVLVDKEGNEWSKPEGEAF
jgi:hypothetical protein